MMRSGGGLIMVLARINNLFIQQLFPINVGPITIKVNECCKTTCGVVVVVVVAVDMLDCSVDTHHCSVDAAELFYAYCFYVSAEHLFSNIPYHTPDKSQTSS
jgi:hypothetical protein